MTRKQVAELLLELSKRVESGDSAEGSLQWVMADSYDQLDVTASIRVGNLDGQGSVVLINTREDRSD